MRFVGLMVIFFTQVLALPAKADPCTQDDFEQSVSGREQCLRMRRFGDLQPDALLVWLHGDVSAGGPASYHFPIAENSAVEFSARKVLAVALVRPGYPDGSGHESTVSLWDRGRTDHYTKANVGEVGAAIERLRDHYKPRQVIVVGHSGGAATTAVLLGMKPGLIDAAVLVSCPCELVSWRANRRGKAWGMSENPSKWIDQIPSTTNVIALTGERDDNTLPEIARTYIEGLAGRQIKAEFRLLPGENHNSAFRSAAVFNAVRELLHPQKVESGALLTPQ